MSERLPPEHERALLDIIQTNEVYPAPLDGVHIQAADYTDPITVYDHPAQLHRIVDGDTQYYLYDYHHETLTERRDTRLLGIDTAETYGVSRDSEEYARGKEQEGFVMDWLATGEDEWSTDDWPFRVFSPKAGKYGRDVVVVYRRSDGASLNQSLIDEYGDGIRYD